MHIHIFGAEALMHISEVKGIALTVGVLDEDGLGICKEGLEIDSQHAVHRSRIVMEALLP